MICGARMAEEETTAPMSIRSPSPPQTPRFTRNGDVERPPEHCPTPRRKPNSACAERHVIPHEGMTMALERRPRFRRHQPHCPTPPVSRMSASCARRSPLVSGHRWRRGEHCDQTVDPLRTGTEPQTTRRTRTELPPPRTHRVTRIATQDTPDGKYGTPRHVATRDGPQISCAHGSDILVAQREGSNHRAQARRRMLAVAHHGLTHDVGRTPLHGCSYGGLLTLTADGGGEPTDRRRRSRLPHRAGTPQRTMARTTRVGSATTPSPMTSTRTSESLYLRMALAAASTSVGAL